MINKITILLLGLLLLSSCSKDQAHILQQSNVDRESTTIQPQDALAALNDM